MKIISKYKDYYDYLKGIYGEDPLLVLDRTKFDSLPYNERNFYIETIYIGNYQIEGMWKDNKILYGKELLPYVIEDISKYRYHEEVGENPSDYYIFLENTSYKYKRSISILNKPLYLGDKCPTWEKDCPLLRKTYLKSKYYYNIKLSDYNIQSFIKPEEIWQWLSEWLSQRITKNEKEVPIGDDLIRLKSHGFDENISFRHRK